jgi:hypothetical protein
MEDLPASAAPSPRDRARSRRVGAIALLVLAALFALAMWLQRGRDIGETKLLALADDAMRAGLRGDCLSYLQAQALYLRAMRLHLQSKELAAKAAVSGELARSCRGNLLPGAIAARRQLIASGAFTAEDVKVLALALLASGQTKETLDALAKAPADDFCQWLARWLRSLDQSVRQ